MISTKMIEFVRNHEADDIVYALKNSNYFNLSSDDVLELTSFIFNAINVEKAKYA